MAHKSHTHLHRTRNADPRLSGIFADYVKILGMLAHNHGQLFNASKIAASLGVSSPTVSRYLDILADLFMVRIVHPWSENYGKRLVKTPKYTSKTLITPLPT